MKRKKIYILTTLLVAVIIFSTAAICNQCSIAPSTTTEKVGVESTTATGTTTAQNISDTTVNATETTLTQEQQQVIYTYTQYGFSFSLPLSWEGYQIIESKWEGYTPVSYTHLRAHETDSYLVC